MKKPYIIPDFEVEHYELNTSIASGCGTPVSNGPAINDHPACDGFDIFGEEDPFARIGARSINGASFYDDGSCRCYYSSGGEGYWTS